MVSQEFPISVVEKIGYYVYLLIDPETKDVFYIGKGTGNRVFNHANAAIDNPNPGEKLGRIRSIHENGLAVEYLILRHGMTEESAFEVESALIDYVGIDALTNKVHGMSSDDRGKMSIVDIIAKYAAPEIVISEPSILITVNRLYRKGMNADELYEITRGNWVIGKRREKIRHAFAVYNGVIRQVYSVKSWQPVLNRNPSQKISNRWRFDGEIAVELQHYVGGSVTKYSKTGAQNPIRYVNC